MDVKDKLREPILWWTAGADSRVLADCPRGDQIFIQHLGISLIGAFLFVFLISGTSILIAFPDLANNNLAIALALSCAFLIATMVFLIDRLFIQSDWDWQAAKQRRELARASWEATPLEEKLTSRPRELNWWFRISRFFVRLLVVSFRILLSATIGLTIASFLELVIYKDELKPLIQRLHYEDNKAVYDEINTRKKRIDQEIATARGERDRLVIAKGNLEAELNKLELTPPQLPSDRSTANLDEQIAEIRAKIAEEQANVRKYAQDMVGEFHGTVVNPGNSGLAGAGQRYWTALDLKTLSETAIAQHRNKIAGLEAEKARVRSNREAEQEVVRTQVEDTKTSLRTRLESVVSEVSEAQNYLVGLENGREAALEAFTLTLKSRPDFVPLSFGVASQFRALRTLYKEYGSTFEMYMIKALIMMLEMTPVLLKVFLSPTTLYAVKLDAAKRAGAYGHFEEELRLRQEHLRNKFHAAVDEAYDGQDLERVRKPNIRGIHEGRG